MILLFGGFLFGMISYGSPKAEFVLVTYFDLGCKMCLAFHKKEWPTIKKRWCRTDGPLRVIFKPYPVSRETVTFMACCEKLTKRQQQLLFETLMAMEVPSMVDIARYMQARYKYFIPYTPMALKEALLITNHHQFTDMPVMFMNGQRLSDDQQDAIIPYLEELLT